MLSCNGTSNNLVCELSRPTINFCFLLKISIISWSILNIFILVGESIAMQLSSHKLPNDINFSCIFGNKVAYLAVVETI